MKYVALLRGINVGGNNKVDMTQLTKVMSDTGFSDVSTYINSGNIFFESSKPVKDLTEILEKLIKDTFGLNIKVLLKNQIDIGKLSASIPSDWVNGEEMKCDVMFLWGKYNDKSVMEHLTIKPGIDEVIYAHGALFWKVDKKDVTRSGMMKLVGTDIYANMTIRNCNTVRKIQERIS